MKHLKLLTELFILTAFVAFIGCSSNPTNSIDDDLVGVWWYLSATQDGSAITFNDISHGETSVDGKVTFNADGTWSSTEYDATPSVVFTQSGTYSADGGACAGEPARRRAASVVGVLTFNPERMSCCSSERA